MKNMDKPKDYDNDFYGWSLEQAHLIKKGEYQKVDWENIIEEIESLGRSEKRTLRSFLKIHLLHLLKKKYQPNLYCKSWEFSIQNSKRDFLEILKENPSLKPQLAEILKTAYEKARLEASQESGLDENVFPDKCPWTIKEILKD